MDATDRTGVDPLPSGPDGLVCSSRGCLQTASTDLQWNNPKIHHETRRKHWLACADHTESLTQFLSARGFFRTAVPL